SALSASSASPLRHLIRQQRPALVIAPDAGDFKVLGRETFLAKSTFSHQRERRRVVRLDVGLHAMEIHITEGVARDEPHPFGHVPPARKGLADTIAKVGGLEEAA